MGGRFGGGFVLGVKFAKLDFCKCSDSWNSPLMNEPTPTLKAIRPAPSQIVGVSFAIFGAAFFATKGVFIKLALMENVDVLTTLTWRMILSAPIFIAIGYWGHKDNLAKGRTGKLTGALLVRSALVGALGYYVASFLDFKGLEFVTVQFDRLILMTYPIFVVLISALVLKTKITGTMIGALALSYAGLAVIFLRDLSVLGQEIYLGGALVLGAALAFALYQIFAKPIIDEIGARLFTSIAMASAGFAVVVHFLLVNDVSSLALSGKAMFYMAGIALASTLLPAYFLSAAIGRIGPQSTAVLGNVSPLVTAVLAVSILGEAFTVFHAIGTAMVIAGVILFTRQKAV